MSYKGYAVAIRHKETGRTSWVWGNTGPEEHDEELRKNAEDVAAKYEPEEGYEMIAMDNNGCSNSYEENNPLYTLTDAIKVMDALGIVEEYAWEMAENEPLMDMCRKERQKLQKRVCKMFGWYNPFLDGEKHYKMKGAEDDA